MSVRTNIVWYGLPSLLDRLAIFLLLPLYTRVLLPEELGTAMVAVAVGALASLLVAPGTEKIYLRFMVGSDRRGASAVAMLHFVALAGGLAILLVFARPLSALAMPGIPTYPFYYVAVASTVLATLVAPLLAEWRAQHRARAVAVLEAARLVVSVATTVVALLWLELGPVSILLGPLFASAAVLPWTLTKFARLLAAGWSGTDLLRVLPLMSVAFPMGVYEYARVTLDRLMLHRFSGEAEVAVYVVGYAIGGVVMVGAMVMNREWQPLILNLSRSDHPQPAALQSLWTRSLVLFLVLGGFVAVGANDFVRWFGGPEYFASAAIVPWIALIAVLRIPRSFLQALSFAYGKSGELLVESLVSLGFFVGAIFLLVPRYGAVGAAWAGVIASAVGCGYLYSRSWSSFRFDRSLIPWTALLLLAILFGGAMDGSALSRVVGAAILAASAYQGSQYWRFLGTLRPLGAGS